jgi:uncharacterized membrane protein YoaK (UPF0700 family)
MPIHFVRSLTSRERNRRANWQLGLLLAFVAGAMNAIGFASFGKYISHMSGLATSIGTYLAAHSGAAAAVSAGLLLAFLAGAITTCVVINIGRTRELGSVYAMPLFIEGALLLGFIVMGAKAEIPSAIAMLALLCYAMGLQNAIITKISNAEIRTTHVTGLVTDMGIELGRWIYRHGSGDARITLYPDRLAMHSSLFFSFVVGGIAGAIGFSYAAFMAVVPLSVLLLVLALIPLLDDIRRRK